MMKLYYLIWADAINSYIRSHPNNHEDWKIKSFMIITFAYSLSIWTIFIWLSYFNVKIPLVNFNFFPGEIINNFLSFAILFVVPIGLLNYFLVFYKMRYKRILKEYARNKTGYAFNFFVFAVLMSFSSTIFYASFR